jgi:hypothetical protein
LLLYGEWVQSRSRSRFALGILLSLTTAGCPSSGTVAPGTNVLLRGGDSGGLLKQPSTYPDCSDPAHCLSGTAVLAFGDAGLRCPSGQCTTWQADLFDSYPAGSGQPIANPVLIAQDGTWVFDGVGVEAGISSGYYVQLTAVFGADAGSVVASTVVGPLTLPTIDAGITLSPVQAAAYESRGVDAGQALDWVLARLYDPKTGAPIASDAQVSVNAGMDGGATDLAPTVLSPGTAPVYYVAFAQPPAAQGAYTITASHPAYGDAGIVLHLVADPPTFDGTITSADAGADGAVTVRWTAEPQASYEVVSLFAEDSEGGLATTAAYSSQAPLLNGQTSVTTGPLHPGTYLVNVAYTKANCPLGAGGCVQAAAVAAATTTVP